MKFEFKGLSSYEENSTPNYVGDTKVRSVIQDFVNMDEAIEFVSNHHGFSCLLYTSPSPRDS